MTASALSNATVGIAAAVGQQVVVYATALLLSCGIYLHVAWLYSRHFDVEPALATPASAAAPAILDTNIDSSPSDDPGEAGTASNVSRNISPGQPHETSNEEQKVAETASLATLSERDAKDMDALLRRTPLLVKTQALEFSDVAQAGANLSAVSAWAPATVIIRGDLFSPLPITYAFDLVDGGFVQQARSAEMAAGTWSSETHRRSTQKLVEAFGWLGAGQEQLSVAGLTGRQLR